MLRVLFCDDEEMQMRTFSHYMTKSGNLSARVAFDPDTDTMRTWEKVRASFSPGAPFPYDIVVTDMNFGGAEAKSGAPERLHGLEVYRYIRSNWPHVEVIVISNYMGMVPLAAFLSAIESSGAQRIHSAQWVSRSKRGDGEAGWDVLMTAIEQAAGWIEERRALAALTATNPLFDVLVVAKEPLVLEVSRRPKGHAVRLAFEQPKAALVLRALCEGAPHFLSPSRLAERVRELIGTDVPRRLSESDLGWFFEYNNVEPPCGRNAAKVAVCEFDPLLMSEEQRKYTQHPCSELAVCPFDILLQPVRRASDGMRKDRFSEDNVKTHIYQIKNRIAEALRGGGDADEWRELLVQGRPGVGYAVAACVEWQER